MPHGPGAETHVFGPQDEATGKAPSPEALSGEASRCYCLNANQYEFLLSRASGGASRFVSCHRKTRPVDFRLPFIPIVEDQQDVEHIDDAKL